MATLHAIQAAVQEAISGQIGAIVVGNKQTITFGGTITGADVLTLTLTAAALTGSPIDLTYTVKPTDRLSNIAAALARTINTNAVLQAAGLKAIASSSAPVLYVYYPAGLSIAWTRSLSAGATETVAITGLVVTPETGTGWPPIGELQEVARGGAALISVYDRKLSRNTTRWKGGTYNLTVTPATLTTVASTDVIPPEGTATITLGGAVTPGDAVSAVFTNRAGGGPAMQGAQVVIGGSADTPSTMATALATAINADALLSLWAHAAATGPVVTVTSLLAATQLGIASYAGNGGSQTRELGRRERSFQVVAWTQTEVLRETLTDPIDVLLAGFDSSFGIVLGDGSAIRVMYDGDYYLEDDMLEDVYRRDFMVRVDYPVTTVDQLYAVLAPVAAFQVEN